MKRYLLRRAIECLPVLALVLVVGFALVRLMPGDPAAMALGEKASAAELAAERQRQGLDRPLPAQFAVFVRNLAALDLPRSRQTGREIPELIGGAFLVTLRLALGSMFVAVALGLGLGLVSARWPGSWLDWLARTAAVAGVSVPVFWLAMLLLAVFAVRLPIFPLGSYRPGDLSCLVLPCLALGLVYSAGLARVSRAALLEELTRDYCRTARAKGASRWGVLLDHALPNAMVPMVTVMGSQLAGLLTGAVLTETVFGLPGLGQLMWDAIQARDRYVLILALLFVAAIFVLVNYAVDVLYAWLDPRVRYA
ncbi:MAG TPA: ABC transporter permease [Planctomycetota bacterium]|nr:ABC transporter permease [Planctomycetota bacterium]